jgi:hypothetical protein
MGDPTVVGWLAVASYVCCAVWCAVVAQRLQRGQALAMPREAWDYGFLALTLAFLALNKSPLKYT